jgi:hypothetical protein
MNTHSDTHSEDLIDLGSASVETKGVQQFNDDGSLTQPKDIQPGAYLED